MVSKNIQYQPGNISFSNTLNFTLIMLELQITIVKDWKSWYSCFLQLHQGSFHCCHWCSILTYCDHATSQISCKSTFSCCLKYSHKINFTCEHIYDFILISWREKVDLIDICIGKLNNLCAFPKQNLFALQKCVLTLLHIRYSCPMNSTCLQNFKIYVFL